MILKDNKRPDGRALDQIRPLAAEVDIIPRVHGSAMFTRGQTQICDVVTLAPLSDAQRVEGLDPNITEKRYVHHYNFPSYSVGETRVSRGPGRREIGHGALAERALMPVLPLHRRVPLYDPCGLRDLRIQRIHSMASTCASCMALMAAGVPIKKPVAGISCGLVTGETDDDFVLLTDIQGLEDFFGDMDFKVTGTKDGITAIQMDIKIHGLTKDIVTGAIARCREARNFIMDGVMHDAIEAPRPTVNEYAPKIDFMQIDPRRSAMLSASAGRPSTRSSGAPVSVDINDDGSVSICSRSRGMDKAKRMIRSSHRFEEGQILEGVVVSIKERRFHRVCTRQEAWCTSPRSPHRIEHVEDVPTLGDKVRVVCPARTAWAGSPSPSRTLRNLPETAETRQRSELRVTNQI